MTYTHLTTNELVMIEAYYQENIKVSDIVTSLGRSKQTIYNVINYLKEGHSAYDTITDIKSIRNAVAGIKPILRNQKKILSKLIWNKIGALMSSRELIQIEFLVL